MPHASRFLIALSVYRCARAPSSYNYITFRMKSIASLESRGNVVINLSLQLSTVCHLRYLDIFVIKKPV